MISIIAAVGKNRELGNKGGLCFRLREDMKYFKETTWGHPVVMGDRTFRSLPGGALPGRKNYVLSRGDFEAPDTEVLTSLEEAIEKFADTEEEVFIIGGGMVYKQFLPYAKKLYLTEIGAAAEADVFFPEFDKDNYDREVVKSGKTDEFEYSFVVYTRKDSL